MTDLQDILSNFSPIKLNQMDAVSLMKRVDQKIPHVLQPITNITPIDCRSL